MMFFCLPPLDPLARAAAVSQKWQIGSSLWFQSGKQIELCSLHASQSRRVNAAEPKGAAPEQSFTQLEDLGVWLSNTWHLDVKTVSSSFLSAVGSSKANLSIEEKAASLMCVTLPIFMGDLRQAVGLRRELRCVIQRQQAGGWGGMSREMELGKVVLRQPSARGYKSIPLP